MNTPRCDGEITPIDGDTSYAATHCGRVEGHAPEKRSGRIEHQSYAALARKRKGSTLAERSMTADERPATRVSSLFNPEPQTWGLRGDP
jgi:hypothetical protein